MNKLLIYKALALFAIFGLVYAGLASGESVIAFMLDAVTFSVLGFVCILLLLPAPFFFVRSILRERRVTDMLLFGSATLFLIPFAWTLLVGLFIGLVFFNG